MMGRKKAIRREWSTRRRQDETLPHSWISHLNQPDELDLSQLALLDTIKEERTKERRLKRKVEVNLKELCLSHQSTQRKSQPTRAMIDEDALNRKHKEALKWGM